LLQPSYRLRDGVPVVRLFGRLDSGEAFLVEDDRDRPYAFAPAAAAPLLRELHGVELDPSPLTDLAGRPVVRFTTRTPAGVPPVRERLLRGGFAPLEADVRFAYRHLIDRGLRSGLAIEGEPETGRPGLLRFHNPELAPARVRPELRYLSLDIETTPDASRVFAVALCGCGVEEVHLISDAPVAGAVVHEREAVLLAVLEERILALDPDVLLGWNVVDFDLRVLERRGRELKVPLSLGREPGVMQFQQDRGFTRQSRAELPGRVVLDGIPLVRDALRLEDYRLETVARAVLGRGKKIDSEAPDAAAEILRLYREEPEALVAYNLEDARLVLEILEQEGLLALTVERSLLSGMPLDRVGASVASFDMLYLPELRSRGVVAPSVDPERKSELVRGGALLEPRPGLYRNVAVFDFKSLYPSLIRTFRLDPLAHARADGAGGAIVAPNGARFSREEAILPAVLEGFMERREAAKQRGDRHADQAIKIMMNALFGVLGSAGCRFFDPAIANAITGFGQQTLGWTRDAFEAEGVEVIYGDTDSVFVKLRNEADVEAALAEADALRGRIEAGIEERIRKEYAVEPRLQLEFEGLYRRFFLPRIRGGRSGSKKRYAGLTEKGLAIVGLESVRRDWPRIAKRLQEGMLERLFADREVLPFVRELVEGVRAGDHDGELVYVKRLRKGSLDRYTASAPPHVQAARKARELGVGGQRGVIRYVVTGAGTTWSTSCARSPTRSWWSWVRTWTTPSERRNSSISSESSTCSGTMPWNAKGRPSWWRAAPGSERAAPPTSCRPCLPCPACHRRAGRRPPSSRASPPPWPRW
jgi:DNA polymerase-2